MRRSSSLLAATGVLAIAAAGTLRFAVVPAQAQLPADTDTTRSYEGVISVMLDGQALANADLANVVVRDVPVTITRSVAVTGVEGDNATVQESSVVAAPDGSPIIGSDATWVVDRRSMQAQGNAEGLVIGWPIDSQPVNQTGWSSDLGATIELTYTGNEDFQGIDAQVFTTSFSGKIINPDVLANFPASLPKFVLPAAVGALGVDPAIAEALPSLLDVLPDEVPLGYFVTSATTYWVDPTTGMVLDIDRTESRQVAFDVDGIPATPLADVFAMSYQGTTDSVAATVADAKSSASQLSLFGTTLPVALLLLGLVLVGLAVRGTRRPTTEQVVDVTDTTKPRVGASV